MENNIRRPSIIFFGTTAFACVSLKKLFESGFFIQGVITKPDHISPGGVRNQDEIKKFALRHNLPIFQPQKIHENKELYFELNKMHPDFFVVAVYGKILPKNFLAIPKYGSMNVHPSLLPKYRGPSPYQTAILHGDHFTGVTIMLLDESMDHGPILSQKQIAIDPQDTGQSLGNKLADIGAIILLETIQMFFDGKTIPQQQDHAEATFTKRFSREDGHINWSGKRIEIEQMTRAFDPWPGTFTLFLEKRLKILKLQMTENSSLPYFFEEKFLTPGSLIVFEDRLFVRAQDGFLELLSLQIEGKKIQKAKEFIHGYHKKLEFPVLLY